MDYAIVVKTVIMLIRELIEKINMYIPSSRIIAS